MNVYSNTLEEIAESGNERMTVTKMKFEFSQNPIRAIYKTNQMIWGGAQDKTCASLLVALSSIKAPRFHEAIRASLEAALWHPNDVVMEYAALGLIQLNDSVSLDALEDVHALRPSNKVVSHAIAMLLKPL